MINDADVKQLDTVFSVSKSSYKRDIHLNFLLRSTNVYSNRKKKGIPKQIEFEFFKYPFTPLSSSYLTK